MKFQGQLVESSDFNRQGELVGSGKFVNQNTLVAEPSLNLPDLPGTKARTFEATGSSGGPIQV